MTAIFFAFLIVAVGLSLSCYCANSWVKYHKDIFDDQLAEKNRIIEELRKDIEALCVLNVLPYVGNFEDLDYPEDERFDEMLDNILFETNITRQSQCNQ